MGGAVNFENISGSDANETVRGDINNNKLSGERGNDAIYGYAGDDELAAGGWAIFNRSSDSEILGNYVNDSGNTDNDNLYGGAGDDVLYGSKGDNILDGGVGTDIIYSGDGSDTFVIRSGDGSSDLSGADIAKDFTIGSDLIGRNGLAYTDLIIEQGTGSYSNHTIIKKIDSGEILILLHNVIADDLSSNDFVVI